MGDKCVIERCKRTARVAMVTVPDNKVAFLCNRCAASKGKELPEKEVEEDKEE